MNCLEDGRDLSNFNRHPKFKLGRRIAICLEVEVEIYARGEGGEGGGEIAAMAPSHEVRAANLAAVCRDAEFPQLGRGIQRGLSESIGKEEYHLFSDVPSLVLPLKLTVPLDFN